MSTVSRLRIIEKLAHVTARLKYLNKEITSLHVPGVMLTREDLGVRRKDIIHGQKHKQSKTGHNVTSPSGTGNGGESPRVRDFYQEWNPADTYR